MLLLLKCEGNKLKYVLTFALLGLQLLKDEKKWQKVYEQADKLVVKIAKYWLNY